LSNTDGGSRWKPGVGTSPQLPESRPLPWTWYLAAETPASPRGPPARPEKEHCSHGGMSRSAPEASRGVVRYSLIQRHLRSVVGGLGTWLGSTARGQNFRCSCCWRPWGALPRGQRLTGSGQALVGRRHT